MNKELSNNITELLENINWSYILTSSLVDITSNFPLLRDNTVFRELFSKEIFRRFDGSKLF